MNIRIFAIALAFVGPLPAADSDTVAETISPEDLVRDLGDERYPIRVRASEELWNLGNGAEALLREAVNSPDPEIAIRASELLRKIDLGILPDSPPEVVALVLKYDRASANQRPQIIKALKDLRAWRQVLKLHELERDPKTLERIAPEMAGVSLLAAREALSGEDPRFDEARGLLEMGRPEPAQLISLAEFHRVQGTLDRELELARKLKGRAGHLWRYVLHAVAGNYPEAAQEAEACGELGSAARLKLLAGDPIDWLKQAPEPRGEMLPGAVDVYRTTVAEMWKGQKPSPRFVKELVNSVNEELDEESWHSLSLLYAIGKFDVADPLFASLSPSTAFFHFENTERIDMALAALGLDPAKPDYLGLIEKNFKVLFEDLQDEEEASNALLTLAGFLERRGMKQVLLDGYVEPLVKISKANPDVFVSMLGEYFSAYSLSPVYTPVIPAASQFAGDDEGRWSMVRTTLFGEGAFVRGAWDTFDKFRPGMSGSDKLMLLSAILHRVPDVGLPTEAWWTWMADEAAQGKELDRASKHGLMLSLAMIGEDADRFIKVTKKIRDAGLSTEELGSYSDEFSFYGYEILCLGAVGDWDAVAGHWMEQVEKYPNDPMKLAYLAGSLRRAGDKPGADEYDAKVERLALGDTNTMRRIGQAYASCGDFETAAEWWQHAVALSIDDDVEFYFCAASLNQQAQNVGKWKLAAALTEMSVFYQVIRGDVFDSPAVIVRGRMEAEVAKGLLKFEESPEEGLQLLERCRQQSITDGSLADYFLPALRTAGLTELHDQWFDDSWKLYQQVIKRFPNGHNTMNTAAWTASRANRRLDEAEALVKQALELQPMQAAYLDTFGEIWFARGDREKAVEWSDLARTRGPGDDGLLRQNDRFRHDPFPVE